MAAVAMAGREEEEEGGGGGVVAAFVFDRRQSAAAAAEEGERAVRCPRGSFGGFRSAVRQVGGRGGEEGGGARPGGLPEGRGGRRKGPCQELCGGGAFPARRGRLRETPA